jgi:hypothetical protein
VNASIEDHDLNQDNRTGGIASNNARNLEPWGLQPERTLKAIRKNKRATAAENRARPGVE